MIININSAYGEPVEMEDVAEMEAGILECGYELPADGLKEGRDYKEVPAQYMNIATGSVGDEESWWYEGEDGTERNAVAQGEVVEVRWNKEEENWEEVE